MSITQQKEALREQFRAHRRGLDANDYAVRSTAIVDRLRGLPELAEAQTIHCYWPHINEREVDIRPLIDEWRGAGKQIMLPIVRTFGRAATEAPRLRHTWYEGAETLRMNKWGLHEPTSAESVPVSVADAVVVPALGAGRTGYRIGHGFGYYDELLASLSVPTICPVFDACLVEAVPAEPHDIPMTILVTETTCLRPPARNL